MNRICIIEILKKSTNNICSHLNIACEDFNGLLRNIALVENLHGHNNQVCFVDFLDGTGRSLGRVCIKYSSNERMQFGLATEASILNLLYLHDIYCPKILDFSILEQNCMTYTYIVMEMIKGSSVNHFYLNAGKIQMILEVIQLHESVLLRHVQSLNSLSLVENLHKEIDFEEKIHVLLTKYVPEFKLENSLGFLNSHLNDKQIIKNRTVVTDRSVGNILRDQNDNIVMIDFSTARIGTQFDNWIQFIDDPRANFYLKKEDLIDMFIERSELDCDALRLFHIVSIYTNLLQGIFTYEKNHNLAVNYFNNANESFMKLTNKKSMLINNH